MANNNIKVLLIDADGVLVNPPRLFSHIYAEEKSLKPSDFEPFFNGEFREALIGKADLKELIRARLDIWQWEGDPAPLLERWFKAEHCIDSKLLALVQQIRSTGIKVYIATDNEANRTAYLRSNMFPGEVDGIFSSCDINYRKIDPAYFELIIKQLQTSDATLTADNIAFFDDRELNVASARTAGILAEVYSGHDQIERLIE